MSHLSSPVLHHSGARQTSGQPGLEGWGGQSSPSLLTVESPALFIIKPPAPKGLLNDLGWGSLTKPSQLAGLGGPKGILKRLEFRVAVQPSSCGPLSQRKLTLCSQLACRARKGILIFSPRVCSMVFPFQGKWNLHPLGVGNLWWNPSLVLPSREDRGFHNGHLVSPREAWIMWDSKVPTLSRVLRLGSWVALNLTGQNFSIWHP